MQKTLDDYSVKELLELTIEQLLELRRHTVEFIIRTLDPSEILSGLDKNNNSL